MIPLKHNEHMNQLKKIYILESVFDTAVLHDGGEAMEKQLSPICQANGVELTRLVFYSLREFLAEQKNILDSSNADEAIGIQTCFDQLRLSELLIEAKDFTLNLMISVLFAC